MRKQGEDGSETGNPSDFENPIWGIVVFGLAWLASQVVNGWLDGRYLDIVQMIRSWIK